MKKTIICSIPMKKTVDQVVYVSEDTLIPTSETAVRYPVNAFLAETMQPSDELKVILLVKKDEYSHDEQNVKFFQEELAQFNKNIGAAVSYTIIETDFSQSKTVHEQLMGQIVDELDIGAHIIVDTTYGPKDVPVVIFTALNFAEKFLECQIDNILYGLAKFKENRVVNAELCDMIPLYYLGAITNTIHSIEPQKAKDMLKTLLSI